MPRASIWLVRTALLHLGVSATFGAALLWDKGAHAWGALWRLRPVHVELTLLGWLLQLAMGVAFWILPRLRVDGRPTRGRERLIWWSYGLLNAGLAAVVAATLLAAGPRQAAGVALGRLAEAAAVALFAWHAWPRVRGAGVGGRR